jgi:hypothetical protein
MSVDLVTVERVPLMRTGSFLMQSGPVDFTTEHLEAAVAAFENDPAVLAPRIRVEIEDQGHLEDGEIAAEAAGVQAGPALGWVDGLTVDGNTLYGDLHVPSELADVMEWAYPSRSIEGLFGFTTATGHTHDFMATGLLLLGTSWPGVSTLPDVRELEREFAENVAAGAGRGTYLTATGDAAVPVERSAVAARVGASAGRRMHAPVVQAGIAVTDLGRRWYAAEAAGELEGLPDSYDYWSWYVTEIRADDDGNLYTLVYDEAAAREWRFDVTLDGNDTTFSEPYEVMRPEPVRVTAQAPAGRPHVLAAWHGRAESRSITASADPNPQQEDNRPMTDDERRALAVAMGLDPATSESDLHAEAQRRAEASSETPPNPPEDGDGDGTPEGTPPEGTPAPQPEGEPAAVGARTVTVSRETWEATQRDAREGAAARASQIRSERDTLVRAAIEDGRITPAEAGLQAQSDGSYPDGWRRDLDLAPEVTARRLAGLEAGKYPGATARQGVTPQEGSTLGDGYARAAAGLGIAKTTEGVN